MPMNDATSSAPALYAVEQKHSKHLNPNTTIMTATTVPTNMNSNSTLKSEMILSTGGSGNGNSNSSGMPPSHAFFNVQGQKWQQVFDFDKVLKQLRTAEKTFLRGKGGSTDRQNVSQGSSASSSKATVIQVQRLNAQDMQFFDLAPKQTARDIVICNACMGYYTKMGFNNHMMVQHPAIWSSVSNKLSGTHAYDGVYGALHHSASEHSPDGIREVVNSTGEVIGSPTDMSGTVSTCSSNSSSLSSPFTNSAAAVAVAVPPVVVTSSSSRHKSSKSSSSKAGSSSGSNRSRSKTKSHHHISSSSSSTTSTTEVSTSTQSSHKSGNTSKKSASSTVSAHSNSVSVSQVNLGVAKDTGDSSTTPALPITLYSSSSNSSCSLPATPKMVASVQDTSGLIPGVVLDTGGIGGYSPSVLSMHESKDKQDRSSASLGSIKKKAKSPAVVLIQESIDSTTSSSSSSEFERQSHKHKALYAKAPTKPISVNQMPPYEMQLSELDQAVSSITGGTVDNTVKVSSNESMSATSYGQQVQLPVPGVEPIQQNASDENSISLTLDEMLDSKFINEILNTAESEIPFDESVLDPALQQPAAANTSYIQQQQHPSSKRIRYDDGTVHASVGSTNSIDTELGVTDYVAAYQHNQQHYDHSNLENMKLYHHDSAAESHQAQQQMTTIDAMQLQQLIYQQQQMLEAEQKQQMDVDTDGYATLTAYESANQPITGSAIAANQQFSVYNVPSLTDDHMDMPDSGHHENAMIMPTGIIYEITGNNQVSVMDQQSQQQVIAEFLTQAGYDNVEGMNVVAAVDGDTSNATRNANGVNAGAALTAGWSEYNDLCEIDLTKLDTNTTLTSTSLSTSATATTTSVKSEQKAVKMEANKLPHCHPHRQVIHTKNHEDFYFNVYLYAGVPRPLAMNNFGMVKLPQSASTTFRKHLLTTRKANNSLLSLGGSNSSVSRFSPLHTPANAKQNFYGSSTPGSAGGNANEFSIGSITITNASNNNISPASANISQQSNSTSSKNKTIPATLTVVSPTARVTPTTNGGGNGIIGIAANAKTIQVHKSSTISNERIKCVKRALISKIDYNKNGMFTAKKLNDILSGKLCKEKEKSDKNEVQQQQTPSQQEKLETCESVDLLTEGSKLDRMHNFYEKRRKLLNMSSDIYSQNEHNHRTHQSHHIPHNTLHPQALRSPPMQYTHKQRHEKLLKKQLMRTFSDCGINQWKSASNSPSGSGGGGGNVPTGVASNDLMRVFV